MSDTGEIINGCIQHKDIRHLRLYCDYMQLYKYNEHKAKLVRILETWTDSKRAEWYKNALIQKEQGQTPPEPDFWITMSYQQFRHFLYETASVDTIKKNITDLVEKDKHLQRRVNPENPYGPPQYLLNVTAIQKALNKQAATPFIPEVPDLESTPPLGENIPPMKTNPSTGGENTPTLGGKSVTSNNSSNNTSNNNENIYVNADALTRTPSQETASDNENYYQHSSGSSAQDIHSEQASTAIPIATPTPQTDAIDVATRNTDSLVDVTQAVVPPKPPKQNAPLGPLEMPAPEAKWCDETAVQIIEVKKGRRYGPTTRKQELTRAKEALKYEIDGNKITREQFVRAWDSMCDWPLWTEKKIEPMIRHLLKDDRIVSLIQQKPKTATDRTQTKAPSAAVAAGYTDYTNTPPTNYKPLPRKRA